MTDAPASESPEGTAASERETLAAPASPPPAASGPLDLPPVIDRYVLLKRIGSGGMGDVWLADQIEPVRRRVALKVIKAGMDTAQVVARFETERQALALMDHPGIARVLDAGTTREGRPYFVMEVVAGEPITDYCDRKQLPLRQRLELFLDVCAAVQHAHQRAVIHRDLKPTNVLVTEQEGRAAPKIIDFGLAKAMAQPLTERSPRTMLGMIVGTPGYMSPEQADHLGQDIDTRTDVYSLGVILYELLIGTLPHEWGRVQEAGLEGLRKLLSQEDSPRPSARLSTIDRDRSTLSASRRHTDFRSLKRQVAGDLDWITMKALEREKERRYGSPAELAEDIRRHLRNEPVIAGPPGPAYRIRKFVRRHRLSVAAASVLAAGLAIGIIGAGFGYIRARRAELVARHEAATAARVSSFLADVIGSVDPERMGRSMLEGLKAQSAEAARSRNLTPEQTSAVETSLAKALDGVNSTDAALRLLEKEVLGPAGKNIEQALASDPLLAARLQLTLGQTYRRVGLLERAEAFARSAVETRRRILGDRDKDTLSAISQLAVSCTDLGHFDEAETLQREALEGRRAVLGAEHPDTLASMHNLALAYQEQDRLAEARDLYEPTLAARRKVLGPEDPFTLRTMNNLANVYSAMGRLDDAESLTKQVLEIRTRTLGKDDPDTLASQNNLGIIYQNEGHPEKAEPLFVATLDSLRRMLGEDHPDTYRAWGMLGQLDLDEGRTGEAITIFERTLSGLMRTRGPDHPVTLSAMDDLARAYQAVQRYTDAERTFRQALEVRRRLLGGDSPDTLGTLQDLASVIAAGGQPDRARPLVQERLEARRSAAQRPGAEAGVLNAYAWDLLTCEPADMQRPKEALVVALQAAQKSAHREAGILDTLGLAYHRTGQDDQAVATIRTALDAVAAGDASLKETLKKNLATYAASRSARK